MSRPETLLLEMNARIEIIYLAEMSKLPVLFAQNLLFPLITVINELFCR